MKIPVPMKREYYRQLVGSMAPFLFVNNGVLEVYRCYKDLYVTTLQRLRYFFPRGYVDLLSFTSYYTGIKITDLSGWNTKMGPLFVGVNPTLWDYLSLTDKSKKLAECYMRALHLLTDTQLSQSAFDAAWYEFIEDLKEERNEYDEELHSPY